MDGKTNGGVFAPQNLQLFSYTRNNPVNYIDPDGKRWTGILWRILKRVPGAKKHLLRPLSKAGNYVNNIPVRVGNFARNTSEKVGNLVLRGGHSVEQLKAMRMSYVKEVNSLANKVKSLYDKGLNSEKIARILSAERRAIGVKYKKMTPFIKRMQFYMRNQIKYGDKWGPTIKFLRTQKGKSWEQIIQSASKAGGKDLGL